MSFKNPRSTSFSMQKKVWFILLWENHEFMIENHRSDFMMKNYEFLIENTNLVLARQNRTNFWWKIHICFWKCKKKKKKKKRKRKQKDEFDNKNSDLFWWCKKEWIPDGKYIYVFVMQKNNEFLMEIHICFCNAKKQWTFDGKYISIFVMQKRMNFIKEILDSNFSM